MIKYESTNQLSIEEFKTPLQRDLDPENRWVRLAKEIPWEKLVSIYCKKMHQKMGARSIAPRIVIGAMIVKHKLNLSDIETIEEIRENMYIQHFLGLSDYTYEPVFDPSLFVHIRKRLGVKEFDEMTLLLMDEEDKRKEKDEENKPSGNKGDSCEDSVKKDDDGNITHKGDLKVDATVADAEVRFPTDIDLLNDAREKSEVLIDLLCKRMHFEKPRTYRRIARSKYLNVIKKRNKSKKIVRRGKREQLHFLRRNLCSIDNLLDKKADSMRYLNKREKKYLFVIRLVYDQQNQMYNANSHSCQDRIISIHQPHVRPIVRGKSKSQTEFGAKIGVGLHNGFARIDHLSWDAYNEQIDLVTHVENYKKHYGFYPARLLGDKIYLNRANRTFLKSLEIEIVGKALGRPSVDSKKPEVRKALAKAMGERNEVEACFGTAKRRYRMNNIRAKLEKTSASWIAAGYFVQNLMKFFRELLCVLMQIWHRLLESSYEISKFERIEKEKIQASPIVC